jgi:hypothetical protein
MRKIFVLISILFFFFVICSCTISGSTEAEFQNRLWYRYALDYIKHDEDIFQNRIGSAKEGVEHFKSRERIGQSLLNTERPELSDLSRLLHSSKPIDKKIALVNIMLRKTSELELFEEIINILNSDTDMATKFYCYQCFNNLDKAEVNIFRDDFLDIIENEKLNGNIIAAMPTVVKIDSPKIVNLFIKLMSEGSPEIKQVAYFNFSSIDKKYQTEIRSYLESQGAWFGFEN